MSNMDLCQALELQIQQDISDCQELLALLKQEKLLLEENKLAKLPALVEQKCNVTQKINFAQVTREELLKKAGFGQAHDSIMSTLLNLAETSEHKLVKLWQKMVQLVDLIQDHNLSNGQLLNSTHSQARKILESIYSQATPDTYSKTASLQGSFNDRSRPLTSA